MNPADALNTLARHYKNDGDVMICRACKRRQQIAWYGAEFPHKSGCDYEDEAHRHPWAELHDMVGVAFRSRSQAPEST